MVMRLAPQRRDEGYAQQKRHPWRRSEKILSREEGDGQERNARNRPTRHHDGGGGEPGSEPGYGQDISSVEYRREQSQSVPREVLGVQGEIPTYQQDRPRQCNRHADNEGSRKPFAEEEPASQCDKHRRQVDQQRGVGYGGEDNRPVPQGDVTRKE